MVLKLLISTTHASTQLFVVELPHPHGQNGKDEVVNICLQDVSEFQCLSAVLGHQQQDQTVQIVTEHDVGIGSETKHAESLRGQPCAYVEPLDPQGAERGSWHHSRGCGSGRGYSSGSVGTNPESLLLLRAYVEGRSTGDAADKGVAARQPVAAAQDPHPNGIPSTYQDKPVNPAAAHPPAAPCVHLPWVCAHPCAHPCLCAPPGRGAQPTSHPGGCRTCEPSPSFLGMVMGGGPAAVQASEAELQLQPTVEQEIQRLRSILLFVPRSCGGFSTPTATMDTGAGRNVMTRQLAELLELEIDEKGDPDSILTLANDVKIPSQATVELVFSLRCDATLRREIFYVVDELGDHQALLSVELILKLGHLVRPDCECCGVRGRGGARTGVLPSLARL